MGTTWEDLILETLPLRQEILDWCKVYPEFQKDLKALASERFLHIGAVMITHPPGTNDEAIGIYTYDYKNNLPLFKQDFIIDVGRAHKEFILYTGFPKGTQNTQYVKHINDFLSKYGKSGNYADTHHLTFDQLPADKEIRERAARMIQRSKNLPKNITNLSPQMAADFTIKIKEAKKNGWVDIRKQDKDGDIN